MTVLWFRGPWMSFDQPLMSSALKMSDFEVVQWGHGTLNFASIRDMHPRRPSMKDATFAAEKLDYAETKLTDSVADSHCERYLIDVEKILRAGWQMTAAAAAGHCWVDIVDFLHNARSGFVSTLGRDSRGDSCHGLIVPQARMRFVPAST